MKNPTRGRLGWSFAAPLLTPLLIPLAAQAFPIEFGGDVQGSIDTTVSLGASMRTEDADPALFGISNGGTSRSVNDDDGNQNYQSGDLVSVAAKATHDLELRRKNIGLFSRVTYFYDFQAADDDFLGPIAQERLESQVQLLDLFVSGSFNVAGRNVSARVGKQVVNWGESTFIGNSINSINPVDVAKLRTPGAEIKEALIPSTMLWGSFDLADSVSMEAFWLLNYDKTRIDPRNSFFSTNDFISDDGDRVYVGFGRRRDQHFAFVPPAGANAGTAQVWLPRAPTRNHVGDNDREQYGVAARYLADWANNTEFGLFYMKYHNRTPLVSAIRGGSTNITSTSALCRQSAVAGCRGEFFDTFPGKIDLYGLSYNTTAPGGIAVQGEYSYRRNQPVQLAAVEVLLAALGLPNNVTGTVAGQASGVAAGTVIEGFRRVRMHQFQTTATKAFGPTAGAEQFVLLGEAGANYLELPDGLLFAGPGTALPAPGSANAANGSFQTQGGYASRFSWGYRAVARMDFENAIGPASLSPRLVFAHDVIGVGPNFNRGTKAVTAGLAYNYLQRWQADVGYTSFFDGRVYSGTDTTSVTNPDGSMQPRTFSTAANPNKDRDFVALSVSYAF